MATRKKGTKYRVVEVANYTASRSAVISVPAHLIASGDAMAIESFALSAARGRLDRAKIKHEIADDGWDAEVIEVDEAEGEEAGE